VHVLMNNRGLACRGGCRTQGCGQSAWARVGCGQSAWARVWAVCLAKGVGSLLGQGLWVALLVVLPEEGQESYGPWRGRSYWLFHFFFLFDIGH
jgi:hypothetical protein